MFKKLFSKIRDRIFILSWNAKNDQKGFAFIPWLIIIGISALIGGAAIVGWDKVSKFLGETGRGIVSGFSLLLYLISREIFKLAQNMLDTVLSSDFLTIALSRTEIVKIGFVMVRDIANILIVLGFIVIGIATILRIREYEAQKVLLPLILVAILINFSLVFCGIIIDISNVVFDHFKSSASGLTDAFRSAIEAPDSEGKTLDQRYEFFASNNYQANFAILAISFTLIYIICAYTFIVLGVLLIVRQAMLMILMILSPLAFFCIVFPSTKHLFKKWWEVFLEWCFVGIATIFLIYLATYLVAHGVPGVDVNGVPNSGESLGNLSFIVPIVFLLLAAKVAKTTGAMGATFALGAAATAGGFALGAVRKVGGGVASKFAGKDTRIGQALGNARTRLAESVGLAPKGQASLDKKNQLDTEQKRAEAVAKADPGRAQRLMHSGSGTRRAAYTAAVAKEGKIDLDKASHRSAMTAARLRGADFKEAEKKNPLLASTRPEARQGKAAEYGEIKKVVNGMNPGDYRKNISKDSLKPGATIKDSFGSGTVISASSSGQIGEVMSKGSQEQKNAINQWIQRPDAAQHNQGVYDHIKKERGTEAAENFRQNIQHIEILAKQPKAKAQGPQRTQSQQPQGKTPSATGGAQPSARQNPVGPSRKSTASSKQTTSVAPKSTPSSSASPTPTKTTKPEATPPQRKPTPPPTPPKMPDPMKGI